MPPSPPIATVLKAQYVKLNVWTCEKLTFHLVFIYYKTELFYTKHLSLFLIQFNALAWGQMVDPDEHAEVLKLWKTSSESIQMGILNLSFCHEILCTSALVVRAVPVVCSVDFFFKVDKARSSQERKTDDDSKMRERIGIALFCCPSPSVFFQACFVRKP